jgi:hypothetical protein
MAAEVEASNQATVLMRSYQNTASILACITQWSAHAPRFSALCMSSTSATARIVAMLKRTRRQCVCGVVCCVVLTGISDANQTSRRQCRHSSMFQCIGREMKSCMQLQTNTCRQSSSTSQPHEKATCPVNTPPRASHVHATCGTSPPPRPETVGPLSPRNRQTCEPARRLIGEGRNGWSRIGPCGARARIGGMYV